MSPWIGVGAFYEFENTAPALRPRVVVEIPLQRTEVENKIRNVPVDVVELASTITLGEQVVGSLFHQRTAAYITYFRRDLTMDGVSGEVAWSSGSKQCTMPNVVYSDDLCSPFAL